MSPLLWERVERAFQEALAMEPANRRKFLAAISDPEILGEVESLLSADGAGMEQNLERAISATAMRVIKCRESYSPGSKFSHYRLLQLLGSGGMSEVYLAEDLQLGRKAALKFLPAALSEDGSRVRRFEREARATSALNHPNIVTIYEIGNAEGQWFIAMEYVPGESLGEKIHRGAIPIQEALLIAEQVADALAQSHQSGILHRDIKPANIMLRTDGAVKLVDFGVARVDPLLFEGGQSTYSGRLLGTPAYMSPEQAKGLALTAATDLWSLGAVLYEMITGTKAFRGSATPEILVEILARRPVPPSKKVPAIPREVDSLIMKLLSQNPSARHPSAHELCLAIKRLRLRASKKPWRRALSLFVPGSGRTN